MIVLPTSKATNSFSSQINRYDFANFYKNFTTNRQASNFNVERDENSIYVTGPFFGIADSVVNNFSRGCFLDGFGQLSKSFRMKFNGPVYDAAYNSISGEWICVGSFTEYNGTPVNKIAIINESTGALNTNISGFGTGFAASTNTNNIGPFGLDQTPYCVLFSKRNGVYALSYSEIYIGGDFTSFDGDTNKKYIIKIFYNANYSSYQLITSGFRLNLSGNTLNGPVYDMVADPYLGGSTQVDIPGVIMVGNFTLLGATTKQRLLHIDTDGYEALTWTNAINNAVYCIEADLSSTNQTIWIGGAFTSITNYYNTTYAARRIIKLNCKLSRVSSWPVDTSFDSVNYYPNNSVYCIENKYDNTVYIGGAFTSVYDTPNSIFIQAAYVTHLNSNASIDTTFNTNRSSGGTNGPVFTLYYSYPHLIVGGSFTHYYTTPTGNLVRLFVTNGTLDTNYSPKIYGPVYSVTGVSAFGGFIGSGNDVGVYGLHCIAKFNLNTGKIDTNFDTTNAFTTSDAATPINGLLYASNTLVVGNYIYVIGTFGKYKNTVSANIIKLNKLTGAADASFICSSMSNTVSAIAYSASTSSLYLIGTISSFNGVNSNRIVKINPSNASVDSTFATNIGTGFNAVLDNGLIDPSDGSLYVAGNFSSYNGTTRRGVAKLNASNAALDTNFVTDYVSPSYSRGFITIGGYCVWMMKMIGQKIYFYSNSGASVLGYSSRQAIFCVDKSTAQTQLLTNSSTAPSYYQIPTGYSPVFGMCSDSNFLYFTDFSSKSIYKIDTSSTGPESSLATTQIQYAGISGVQYIASASFTFGNKIYCFPAVENSRPSFNAVSYLSGSPIAKTNVLKIDINTGAVS